jgi:hypothetical protein
VTSFECVADEYEALARQLHESIAEGQTVAETAIMLRILGAPDRRGLFEAGRATGTVEGWADYTAAVPAPLDDGAGLDAIVNELATAGWPHEYPDGYHKMPGCRGCELRARLGALAETLRNRE